MSDKEMEARLGHPRGKLELVALPEAVYKRVMGMWEPLSDSADEP